MTTTPAPEGGGSGGTSPTNTMSIWTRDDLLNLGESGVEVAHGARTLAADQLLYIRLCEEGRLYEHVQALGAGRHLSREDFKKKVFQDVFYGRNEWVADLTRRFEGAFPNVMSV